MPGRLFIPIILLAFSACASAQVYKWTDESGVVHYGDEQPGQSHQRVRFEGYSEIDMSDNIRASETISRERRASQDGEPEKKRSKQHDQAQREAEAEKVAATCQSYIDRIDWIDSRLRAGGYSVKQGNRLRAERRELSGKRAWECLRR